MERVGVVCYLGCAAVLSMVLTTPRFRLVGDRSSRRHKKPRVASSPVAFTPLCTVHVRAESSGVSSCHSCADEDGAGCFFFFWFVTWPCSGKQKEFE